MDAIPLEDFTILAQKDPEMARQSLLEEKRRLLEAYQKALQEKEIEWLERQVALKNN